MTCTEGRNRPASTPVPRTMAWVARGVVMNRSSSAAADDWCCSARAIADQAPRAWSPGPSSGTSRRPVAEPVTENRSARAIASDRWASSSAAASLWKKCLP